MSNPFEALNISDDEEDRVHTTKNNVEKTRKTHKERKELKKQHEMSNNVPKINANIPERVRDNSKVVHNPRAPRPSKDLPAGHVHDRRSGTGRDDKPRKDGGGRGNVGNLNDLMHKEKYENLQPTAEQVEDEEPKEEEPQPLTLAEYYESKGIDVNQEAPTKNVQRNEVNAEWIKKEKLQVLETKEDKRRKEESSKQNINRQNNTRVEMSTQNSEMLGFGTRPQRQPREEEPRERDNRPKGGKRNNKPVISNEDFPTL